MNSEQIARCLALAAVLTMAISSIALADSARIVFVTDRTTADDLDLWKMKEDGTYPTEVTDESGSVFHPSASLDGEYFIYDDGTDLFMVDHDGEDTPVNLTSGTSAYPCHNSGTDLCADPDVGELDGFGSPGDFRIVFTRRSPHPTYPGNPLVTDIWMATYDASEEELTDFAQLTEIASPAYGEQLDPAWCGPGQVVWSRVYEYASFYQREICIMEVDDEGPVGDPECYGSDNDEDRYPTCNATGSKLAWARKDSAYGQSDIFIMDCDGLD
jgi:hypothetical protein